MDRKVQYEHHNIVKGEKHADGFGKNFIDKLVPFIQGRDYVPSIKCKCGVNNIRFAT